MGKKSRFLFLIIGGLIFITAVLFSFVHPYGKKPATATPSTSGIHSTPPSVNHSTKKPVPKVESATSTFVSGDSASIVTIRSSATIGKYLADAKGQTLYIYTKDLPDESKCDGACAKSWPPYTTASIPHLPLNVSDFKRADGKIQYTFKGYPLYFYANEKPGVISGNGVNGFSVAKP
jgi:predicted lipoprotein with Yx(FWY)xxD motif